MNWETIFGNGLFGRKLKGKGYYQRLIDDGQDEKK